MSSTNREASFLHPGQVLEGKFRVERILGEGGMGVVVAATHLTLGQVVAIKVMLPQALHHAQNVERFEREARAAVRLKSEHIARVSDVGRLDNALPYMVMEYLHGEDLDQVLERVGPLPINVAVDYLLQTCEAVHEAHTLGIIHRDLKPRNLFLTTRSNGRPLIKVLDFGISKSIIDGDLSLTSTTQIMGSPNYMSPEQLRSARTADQRTDIWALGVILYELLADTVPFVAESVTELTVMVVQDPPRPLYELRPDVPPPLLAAISRCLEKQRESRFQTVAELVEAIAPFASAEGFATAQAVLSTSSSGGGGGVPGSSPSPSQPNIANVFSVQPGFAASTQPELVGPPSDPASVKSVQSVRLMPHNGASTGSGWDRTQLAGSPYSRRWPIFVGVGIAVVAVLGVTGFELVRHHQTTSSTSVVAVQATQATQAIQGPTTTGGGGSLPPLPLPPPPPTNIDPSPAPTTTTSIRVPPRATSAGVGVAGVRAKPDAGAAPVNSAPPGAHPPPITNSPPVGDVGSKPPVSGKHQPPDVRN